MVVYRLSRTKYANDLLGEGARLNGGRWNNIHFACIYTAESRALAVLEYTVNTSLDDIPRSLSMLTLEIPDRIMEVNEVDLPGNWKISPAPASTKNFGTKFLKEGIYPVLKLPSIIIPQEFNYLINPFHKNNIEFKILNISDFVYDARVKA